LSADGRYAVYSSRSSDLGGSGSGYRIWVRDLQNRSTTMACRAGNAALESPVVSADGRRVAFETRATNLAGSDVNQQADVYWCDLESGELRRVSTPIADGVNSSGTSLEPAISGDGRYVAFTSDAGGLVPGDGTRAGVYWKDMGSGEIRLVDAAPGTTGSNGIGLHPAISADGQYVSFDSDATDLPGGDLNGTTVDVFRRDMATGVIDLVSQGDDGGAQGDSTAGSISGDANVVAFTSQAADLTGGDDNGTTDVFTRNMVSGAVVRVSTKADGSALDGPSYAPAVSGDGRFVAFASRAAAVTPSAGAAPRARIYRKDVDTGAVDLASIGIDVAPRTLIDAPLGKLPRRKLRSVTGTAQDDGTVARVDVSLSRSLGNGRCLWLAVRSRVVKGECATRVWVRSRLDSGFRFSLQVRHSLPRGTWHLRTRATDGTRKSEPARVGHNSVTLKVV
jgi:Tol biopolymer transport system component